jgi:protein associated with RNAse G/E
MAFESGDTVVRRDAFRGKVWSAHALRVVQDTPEALVAGCRPGADVIAATTWIQWLLTGDDDVRKQAIPNLAAGRWQLDKWQWRDTAHLLWSPPQAWFSVNAFYDLSDGHRLDCWYINFERPRRSTTIGFDTFDLLLDLVVTPDLSMWTWKDEDEYAQGRRLGVISDADHEAVGQARDQAVAMIEQGEGPFADWRTWRSESTWGTPTLPSDALTADLP